MKGISPMIAVVLIIAFTVAVGGIISVWLSSLTTTQTTATSTEAEKQIKCARSVLEVSEVIHASADLTSVNVTAKYQTGSEALTGFNLFFVDNVRDSANQTQTGTLNPGDVLVWSAVPSPALSGATLQEVRLQAFCQTTYPVIGECKAGEACMLTPV